MAAIELRGVWKVYGDGTVAVRDLDLDIADGEFMVFVGPSGCGKTTALRMVAGLEDVSGGQILIGGRDVSSVAPKDRDVAMVFQNYALYPHLTVSENIGFGLRLRKVDKREIERRVEHAAELLGIAELLDRRPRALSGGQRQRVAMGRAIVREPAAFLMDEPLSNLDAKLRVQTRTEILRIQKELSVTTLYVTHDQVEAMTMGDRVAVMRRGVVQQVDAPAVLYDHPANLFVAGFIGSPAMNLLRVRLERGSADGSGAPLVAVFGRHRLPLPAALVREHPELEHHVNREVVLGLRPEDFEDRSLGDRGDPATATIDLEADLVERLGSETLAHFTLDAPPLVTEDTRELAADRATDGGAVGPQTELVARLSARSAATKGLVVPLTVDMRRAHFFDPATGEVLAEATATELIATHQ